MPHSGDQSIIVAISSRLLYLVSFKRCHKLLRNLNDAFDRHIIPLSLSMLSIFVVYTIVEKNILKSMRFYTGDYKIELTRYIFGKLQSF